MNDQTVYLVAPSRDFRSNVLSISKAVTTMHLLNYRTAILSGSYNSIIKARNGMIDSIKELGDTRRIVRAWLMDDDNQIEAPIKDLVDGIKYADENKISIAAGYPRQDGQSTIVLSKRLDEKISDKDMENLQPFQKIFGAGFGCYYGDVYTDYTFHSTETHKKYTSEDYFYFMDHPQIDLRYWKIPVSHFKETRIIHSMWRK